MRKLDLANKVKDKVGGMSKKEAGLLVNLLIDTVRDALVTGENVKISGFGSFVVRQKEDRIGRNPHSGEELVIPARKVLTFKPSQLLRDALNK
jgi:integration host factor subunit alpha